MRAQCCYQRRNGKKCQANATASSGLCFFHDPDRAADRRAAQRAGGLRNKGISLPADTPDLEMRNVKNVVALLGVTINQVRRGQIDPRVSNAVGYLSGMLLKAFEIGSLEDRISALETATRNQPQSPPPLDLEGYEFITEVKSNE